MKPPTEEIKSKLRKLHALSERAGTEQEAALASLRIRELLDKHNLDIGVLDASEEQQEGIEAPAGRKQRRPPEHFPILAHAVKELLDVEFFTRGSDRSGWQYFFVGLKANVETAVITFAYLIDSVEDLLDTWKHEPAWGDLWNEYDKRDYRAFRIGVSTRIYDLIWEQKRRAQPDTMELVRIGTEVAKRMISGMQFEKVRNAEPRIPRSEVASYHAGYQRGEQVDPHGAGKRIRRSR